MTFERWMEAVEKIGIRERIFDRPDLRFLCPGSKPRRPYTGADGAFYQLWEDGVPAEFAIGHYTGRGPLLTTRDGLSVYTEARYNLQYGGR